MAPTRYSRRRSIRISIPYVDMHGDRDVYEITICFSRTDPALGINEIDKIESFDLTH